MTKKETLQFIHDFAMCAQMAADATGRDRDYASLRACIERQEREHRAMGRRMVGNIGPRLSVRHAVDYFVCKVLTDGARKYNCGKAPIRDLAGIREDYVRGAVLMSDVEFSGALFRALKASCPGSTFEHTAKAVEALDYAALVSK